MGIFTLYKYSRYIPKDFFQVHKICNTSVVFLIFFIICAIGFGKL